MPLFDVMGRPGSGKTTSTTRAKEKLDGLWLPSITDRPQRPGELPWEEGGEYMFRETEQIIAMNDRGEFASLVDPRKGQGQGKYFYGTPLDYLARSAHDARWWFSVIVPEVLPLFHQHCHGGRILSVYISVASEEFLYRNMLHRGEEPKEARRRLVKSASWDEMVRTSPLPIVEIVNTEDTTVAAIADRMVTHARHFEHGGRVHT